MSRPLMIAAVALASYAAANLVMSLAVSALWRWRVARPATAAPARRARQIVRLRAMPAAAAVVAFMVVTPVFTIFEPVRASEAAGPLIVVLALVGLAQVIASLGLATWSMLRTRALANAWLRRGAPLNLDPPAGMPMYAIEAAAPIVALVGVFSPRLVAARRVIDACTAPELARIVAHERGHLQARDNLKRWLMACAPDALRWTPLHHEIESAWHDAAEDAADDVAAGGDAQARVDLAGLLVKVARLTPEPYWPAATVSPFVEPDGLDRRVRRLLSTGEVPGSRAGALGPLAVTLAAVLAVAAAANPAVLKSVYDTVEAAIAFGR